MAFRYTPTPTPSVSPTISLTPSITPTNTPTGTVCPGLTPTMTPSVSLSPTITPTNTATPTGTINATPTQTTTQTPSPSGLPVCAEYEINNNTFFDVNWTGLICDSETSTGGTIPANTIGYTTCIQVGTLGYTGTPIITIDAYC
jgi:hypothetical protein